MKANLIALSVLICSVISATEIPTWKDEKNGVEWEYLGVGTLKEAPGRCAESGEGWGVPTLIGDLGSARIPESPWMRVRDQLIAVNKSPLMDKLTQTDGVVFYWVEAPALLEAKNTMIQYKIAMARIELRLALLKNDMDGVTAKTQELREHMATEANYNYLSYHFMYVRIPSRGYALTFGSVPVGSAHPKASILCVRNLK